MLATVEGLWHTEQRDHPPQGDRMTFPQPVRR
jgi:hypothetical protein